MSEVKPTWSLRRHFLSVTPSQGRLAVFRCVAILVLFSLALCLPVLWYGAPLGTDVVCALTWMHGFAVQLTQGDLYPRWLIDSNRGAGSPAFYFYPAVPFYIASLPAALLAREPLNNQLAWVDWILLFTSGVAFFVCARRQASNHRALLASLLYMALPYHYETDLWVREDLAELTNYIWAPLLLYFTDKTIDGNDRRITVGLSLTYALMVLSHLPSTLVISICLAAYVVIRATFNKSTDGLVRFSLAITTGMMVSGIYWIPALFSQEYIHSEAWWTWYYDFHHWFFPTRSLSEFRGDTKSFAYQVRIFLTTCITTAMFTLSWIVAWLRRSLGDKPKLIGVACVVLMAWFLMTPLSAFAWKAFPPLAKIQFPSRLATVLDLCTALVFLKALPDRWRREWFPVTASCITLGLLIWCMASADLKSLLDPFNDPKTIRLRDTWVHDRLDPPEYTTRWSPYNPDAVDTSRYIEGISELSYSVSAGTVSVKRWRPREIALSVNLRHSTTITVRQFYFPNWQAQIDRSKSIKLTPNNENGLISMSLPVGSYRISLELKPSLQERWGYLVSGAGILMLGALWVFFRKRSGKSPTVAA